MHLVSDLLVTIPINFTDDVMNNDDYYLRKKLQLVLTQQGALFLIPNHQIISGKPTRNPNPLTNQKMIVRIQMQRSP